MFRNLMIVLGCIAEKLAGPNSVALLTDNILSYLIRLAGLAEQTFSPSSQTVLSLASFKFACLLAKDNLLSLKITSFLTKQWPFQIP